MFDDDLASSETFDHEADHPISGLTKPENMSRIPCSMSSPGKRLSTSSGSKGNHHKDTLPANYSDPDRPRELSCMRISLANPSVDSGSSVSEQTPIRRYEETTGDQEAKWAEFDPDFVAEYKDIVELID